MTVEKVELLKQKGYNNVYIWDAEPREEDPDHSHVFDVHLEILEGDIEIRINGESHLLSQDARIDIPRNTIHYGLAGVHGCRYIVAEKH